MIHIKNAGISKITLQKIGNKVREEENIKTKNILSIGEKEEEELLSFFLSGFKKQLEEYRFTHYTGQLDFNILYSLCSDVFESKIDFVEFSNKVLDHLYEQSDHPNIKSGEFFIVLIENIAIGEDNTSAIGLFKLENTKKFIRFKHAEEIAYSIQKGYKLEGIDKGCLIFNINKDDGYKVLTIDDNHYESEYWKKDFLQIDFILDNAFQTRNYINLLNEFSKQVLVEDQGKKVQAEFLSNTIKLFSENEVLTSVQIEDELVKNYNLVEEFTNFKREYSEGFNMELWDGFEVSKTAFIQQKRKIKTDIKLDTDIQIKLNVNNLESLEDYIEKGFDDDRKMHFYKIYFNEEL